MNIITCTDALAAAKQAGAALCQKITEIEQPVLLLLSGGSALKILNFLSPKIFSPRVTIGVLDERVSNDPAINNCLQLATHVPVDIDTVPKEHETPEELARRFEQALRDWRTKNPDGKIMATVGMGPDGHTFGLFPDSDVFDTPAWVVGYDAGSKNQFPLRVTTTVAFSKLIDSSIWYVCGESKKEMLHHAMDPKVEVSEIPARIIQDMTDVTLFTDVTLSQ